MDYAAPGGHSTEVVEALLTPLEELVALEVALVLDLEVALASVWEQAGDIDLDRVVDDQVDWYLRVDLLRVTAHRHHGIAQCGDVDDCRHPCEILQDDPAGAEGNLRGSHLRGPRGYSEDVFLGNQKAITLAKSCLKKNAD